MTTDDDVLELLQSCGPHESTIMLGDELITLPRATLEAILAAAFAQAYLEARNRAGGQTIVDFEPQDIDLGATSVTLRLITESGEVFSATAPIPDPRVTH